MSHGRSSDRSLSLTGIDGRPRWGFQLASSCREYVTVYRREERAFFSRRAARDDGQRISLFVVRHIVRMVRDGLSTARKRATAHRRRRCLSSSSSSSSPPLLLPRLFRLARSPGLPVVGEESGIDPVVCAGAATSPTHQPRGC